MTRPERLRTQIRRRIAWAMLNCEEREAVSWIRRWFNGTHYANLIVRRNGKNEYWEADALRVLGQLKP